MLTCLSMDSRLRQRHNSGLPRKMHRDLMLQAKTGFRCSQMSASRLSSTSIEFWVGPHFLFAMTPLLILSAVPYSRRWGCLSMYFDSLMRSMRALCFCAISGRSGEECKYSIFLQQDCASISLLCGLALVPKTDPIVVQSI